MTNDVIIPQSESDRKAIKSAVDEAVGSLIRIDAERDLVKNIRNDIKEKFNVPPKIFNQMVRVAKKQNFDEVVGTNNDFEDFYATIFKVKSE